MRSPGSGPGGDSRAVRWARRCAWALAGIGITLVAVLAPEVFGWSRGSARSPAVDRPATSPPGGSASVPPSPSGPAAPGAAAPAGSPTDAPADRWVLLGPTTAAGLPELLRDYCQHRYGTADARLRTGDNNPATDNWECRWAGRRAALSVAAACSWRYVDTQFAAYSDPHDALSWRCYRIAA